MIGHRPGQAGASDMDPTLRGYLTDLRAAVPGYYTGRRDLLDELAAGLVDARDRYLALGHGCTQAAALAVRDSGPVPLVARSLNEFLATSQAARTAATLLATGPLVGALWVAALIPGQAPTALLLGQPVLAVTLAFAVAAAMLTLLSVRRRLPQPLDRLDGRWCIVVTCAAAVLADALILAIGVGAAGHQPGGVRIGLTVAAAAVSLTRLAVTARAGRRAMDAAH